MEIELVEIRDFLASYSPFDALPGETLDRLPGMLTVRYLRRGSVFPPAEEKSDQAYIVRTGALELRDAKGALVDKLGEGDYYAAPCLEKKEEPGEAPRGLVIEDALVYLLRCELAAKLRADSPEFDALFGKAPRATGIKNLLRTQNAESSTLSSLTAEARELIKRKPVIAEANATIQEAARLMSAEGVSSLLLREGDTIVGLLTDRDLRTRCLARGLSAGAPVRDIMTSELRMIDASTPVFQALLLMTRLNIHHLPVTDQGRPAGMITVTDLMRLGALNAPYLAQDIRKAASPEKLREAAAALPELHAQLARRGAGALYAAEALTALSDALTRRLLELAEQKLGPPPVPYAWLAAGSQGRREQLFFSDQDNALLISDDMRPEDDEYFAALARFTCDGLNDCGFVYCPGEAMAVNPKWRGPLKRWREYFRDWILNPDPRALMFSAIFFDLRLIGGEEALFTELQSDILSQTAKNRIFIAHLAGHALSHRPPLGFFRDFVLIHDGEHDDTLDIKRQGVIPIVDLARLFALSEGSAVVNTAERLRAAAGSPSLSEEMGANLEDALELIANLRFQHQARRIARGRAADNYLPPRELSGLQRRLLKDAFLTVRSMQEVLQNRYQLGRFG